MSVPRPSIDRSIRRIDQEIVSLVVQGFGPLLLDAGMESRSGSMGAAVYAQLEELVDARARLLKQLVPERSSDE